MRYTEVTFNAFDGDFVLIGNQSQVYKDMEVGISNLSIKVASQSIIASFKLTIPNIIIGNNSKIYEANVKRLFDLRNNWEINIDGHVRFKNMRTFESTLEYSVSSKGVEIDFTLHGALYSALNHIRIGNLTFKTPEPDEKITLEWAVTELMRASKERIRFYVENSNAAIDAKAVTPRLLSDEEIYEQINSPNIRTKDSQEYKDMMATPKSQRRVTEDYRPIRDDENPLLNFKESAIPDLADMDVIVIAKNESSAKTEYSAVWETELDQTGEIRNITNEGEREAKTSAAALLEAILRDEGLQLIQLPYIEMGGPSNILIIPLTAIAGGAYKEFTRQGAGQTATFTLRSQKIPRIDLLSTNNGVLSVGASTTKGRESQASVMQSYNIAFQNNDETDGKETEKSIYNILEQTAKTITIDSIGLPRLNYYASYSIEFIGSMFTGTYKVIDFEHKIDGNKFTTSFEAVRIDPSVGKSSSEAKAEYKKDNSKNKDNQDDESDWTIPPTDTISCLSGPQGKEWERIEYEDLSEKPLWKPPTKIE